MLVSELLGKRYKERPSDAQMKSHVFLLRGGYIRQVAGGIFSLLTPAKRIAAKIEKIFREEMDRVGGQEVLFPVVLPADLWRESGRFESVGSELMRMKDRTGRDMLLGMTHEEAAVHLARGEAQTYTDYPFMIYQIQTKFRDEPRSRGGLIRVREFTMKDGYSFHTSQEDLEEYYAIVHEAYERIYARAGLTGVISVKSDTGMMGGSGAHEFMYLSDDGEDTLVLCDECGYKSNMEVAECKVTHEEMSEDQIEKIHTPDITDIESLAKFFDVSESRLIKATVFAQEGTDRPLLVFIRGDYEVNEAKLKRVIGREIFPLVDDGTVGLTFGFIGPKDPTVKDIDILYDSTIEGMKNTITGANETDYHIKGFSVPRDLAGVEFVDVHKVNEGDICPECGSALRVQNGIEVGNIFQLGKKYTESMEMTYMDQDGESRHPIMGCYGIGTGRLLACLIEEHSDDYGPIWPMAVAPWQIEICCLKNASEQSRKYADGLYDALRQDYEVLYDNRDVSPGVMFADADLLGVPLRVVISERNMAEGQVEIATRNKTIQLKVPKETAEEEIKRIVEELVESSVK